MNELEVLRILNRYNPWWEEKPIPELKTSMFQRRDFFYLKREIESKEVTSIQGPRRVGKTILLHQLIQFLLEKKLNPKSILYLSMDDEELRSEGATINDVLNTYSKYVIQKRLDSLDPKHYIFLDEIQEIPRWSYTIKNIYDMGYNLKIFISSSSSVSISKGTQESLLGRINQQTILPLKFSEILRYNKILDSFDFKDLRNAFLEAIKINSPTMLYKEFEKIVAKISNLENDIKINFNRYILIGGYPEFLNEADFNKINQKIKEKIKLVFYKDIIRFFKIRDPRAMEDLFTLLARSSSRGFNINNAAKTLDIQRPTLKNYLTYFNNAFLINTSEFYSKSRVVRIRKEKKIYITDVGIRNALIDYLDNSLLENTSELGNSVGGVVFDHLVRLKFILAPEPNPKIFYWRGKKNELDFVIEINNKSIPIELKYQNSIDSKDLISIKEFLKEYKSPFGILLTKNLFKIEREILFIPLWLFLILI